MGHNKHININTSEEDKELAWARLSTMFNTSAGTNVRNATNSVYSRPIHVTAVMFWLFLHWLTPGT